MPKLLTSSMSPLLELVLTFVLELYECEDKNKVVRASSCVFFHKISFMLLSVKYPFV